MEIAHHKLNDDDDDDTGPPASRGKSHYDWVITHSTLIQFVTIFNDILCCYA